ncbi:MAG: hypothetical protein J7K40_03515 [candidate division Zixibacteria bacterium]|nr:hypothetical protein [candidate division Zixibacteria bacterium]
MFILVISAVIILAGIISLLPLKSSLYACISLMAVSIAGLIIISVIEFGIFSTAYFIFGEVVIALLAALAFSNSYRYNAKRVGRI